MLTKLLLLLACVLAAPAAFALTVNAPFDIHYRARDLGEPPGLVGNLGGLTFLAGAPDTLLIGGNAAGPFGAIYSIPLTRDEDGHITGFAASGTRFATATGVTGGIDGGLSYGPDGVLFYTTYRDNHLGQIKPGSSGPDRLDALSPLGVLSSTGSLQFVPGDMPGGGRLKLLSFTRSTWYDATLSPDGNGTFDITLSGAGIFIGGGPEGVVYIRAGNAGFSNNSVLVSEWSNRRVVAYDIDDNGDPLVDTRRIFISDLSSAEGAAIDPVTGDFLFSNYGGTERGVIVVGGFVAPPQVVPLPAPWLMLMGAVAAMMATRRRSQPHSHNLSESVAGR